MQCEFTEYLESGNLLVNLRQYRRICLACFLWFITTKALKLSSLCNCYIGFFRRNYSIRWSYPVRLRIVSSMDLSHLTSLEYFFSKQFQGCNVS